MKNKKGFTLIELLVVIAIIAILAAILFPVFARAKVAAKQTQDISNLKNINMGNQIYLSDYDDTWAIWSSAKPCLYNPSLCVIQGTDINWDDGSAFGLRYMYAQIVNPYIKSGVSNGSGNLRDIWASPLSKGYFPDSKYLYAYNYYTLGGFSGCDAFNAPAGCGTRSVARWGPFADSSYNSAASGTSLQDAARTIAYADGNILMRAPQYVLGNLGADAAFISVWGPGDVGSGVLYNGDGSLETIAGLNSGAVAPPAGVTRDWFTGADLSLLTGTKTVASYADGHVKVVTTSSLYPKPVKTDKWQGALTDNTGWARSW